MKKTIKKRNVWGNYQVSPVTGVVLNGKGKPEDKQAIVNKLNSYDNLVKSLKRKIKAGTLDIKLEDLA